MLELLTVDRRAQATGAHWEGYSCNAVTRVTTHPCSKHEDISPNVLADGKCVIGRGDFLCCSQRG